MKIGFIKQAWHEPFHALPIVRYKICDEDTYIGFSQTQFIITPELAQARELIDNLGLNGTLYNNIKPEHILVVVAALRLAGYEVRDYPK